jgi:triosephosphate isomerase
MSKILIANWKMNPSSEKEAIKLAKASDFENVIVCPPFPFLGAVKKVLKKAILGAQDICFEAGGPFTGEVSGEQLKSMGVEYVIVGHSERRAHLSETDEIVAKKITATIEAGLTPIVCIGETRSERDKGQTREIIDRQIRMAFSLIPANGGNSKINKTSVNQEKFNVILTYEPVWAISTNQVTTPGELKEAESATPEIVQDMISYMEGIVRGLPIIPAFIYGGSVNADNLESFLKCPEIHGGLVGGASLKSVDFKKMIEISKLSQ